MYPSEILRRRIAMITDHVATDCSYIWDCYDQGRYCAARGLPLSSNDHIPGHQNHSEFERGWRDEAAYLADTYNIAS